MPRELCLALVGDFCSNAMEQGFSDVCVALCMDERPIPRVAQTCRAAAIEMPRPTVRRWCEHGYNKAFQKTSEDLARHFANPDAVADAVADEPAVAEPVAEDPVASEPEAAAPAMEENTHKASESSLRGGAVGAVSHRIPITIEEETKELLVHEGQNAEEAVVVFCRENVPDDVSSCIRQLLTTVIEKMEEGA